jgi:hypothetical protein
LRLLTIPSSPSLQACLNTVSPRWHRHLDLIAPPVEAEKPTPQPEPAPPARQTDSERAQLNRTVAELQHEVARLRRQLGGGYLTRVEDDIRRTVLLPGTFRSGDGFR